MTVNDLFDEINSLLERYPERGDWKVWAYSMDGRPYASEMAAIFVNEKDREQQRVMLGPEVDW